MLKKTSRSLLPSLSHNLQLGGSHSSTTAKIVKQCLTGRAASCHTAFEPRPFHLYSRSYTTVLDPQLTAKERTSQFPDEARVLEDEDAKTKPLNELTPEQKVEFYEKYHLRITAMDPSLKGADFVDQCKVISRDTMLSDQEKVARLQSVLRDMHHHYTPRKPMKKQQIYSSSFIKACSILIDVLVKQKDLKAARQVFDGMVKSGTGVSDVTLKTMLLGYIKQLAAHRKSAANGPFSSPSSSSASLTTEFYQFLSAIEKYRKEYTDVFTPIFKDMEVYYLILSALKEVKDTRRCQFYFKEVMQDEYGLKPDHKAYQWLMIAYRDQIQPQYEQIWSIYQEMKSNDIKFEKPNYGLVLGMLKKRLDQLTSLTTAASATTTTTDVATASSTKFMSKKRAEREMEQIKARLNEVVDDMKQNQMPFDIHDYVCMDWDPLEALRDMLNQSRTVSTRNYNTCLLYYMKQNKLEEALQVMKLMREDAKRNVTAAKGPENEDDTNTDNTPACTTTSTPTSHTSSNGKLDHYSYCIIMDALVKDGQVDAAFELYEEMKRENIPMDNAILTIVMKGCQKKGELHTAMNVLAEMIEHHKVKPNIYTFNTLLGLVANDQSNISESNHVHIQLDRANAIWEKMEQMGTQPDKRSFNNYISILAKQITTAASGNGSTSNHSPSSPSTPSSLWHEDYIDTAISQPVQEMLKMYRLMKEQSEPDFITYSLMIHALTLGQHMRSAMQVYEDAKRSNLYSNRRNSATNTLNTTARNMSSKGVIGAISPLSSSSSSSSILPTSVFNALMKGLQKEGKASEAMSVWHDMRSDGVLPDNETYDIVLEGCEQLGLTGAMETIRQQRKNDFERLEQLERIREEKGRLNRQPLSSTSATTTSRPYHKKHSINRRYQQRQY